MVTMFINLFLLGSEVFTEFYTNSAHVASAQYLWLGLHGHNALVPWIWSAIALNSTAAILLLMYELVAEEQGVPADKISGTIQNDLLKEYIARGTYVYPPRPSMRIITDIFEYCSQHVPSWNTISISGYHIREAGSTAAQELAFTLANAVAYVEAAVARGLEVDQL